MPPDVITHPAVGSYAPPDPADRPITTKTLSIWLPIICLILSVGVAWGITTVKLDGKLGATDYQKDQTKLAEQLGELRGDVRVIRAAVCAKSPEVCR